MDTEFDRVPPRLFSSLQARQDEALQKICATVSCVDYLKPSLFFGATDGGDPLASMPA